METEDSGIISGCLLSAWWWWRLGGEAASVNYAQQCEIRTETGRHCRAIGQVDATN